MTRYIEEMKMLRREDEIMDRELKDVKQPAESKSDEKDGKKDETAAGEKNEEKKEDEKKVDFDALRSLSDDGIDMSFLDALEKKYYKVESIQHSHNFHFEQLTIYSKVDRPKVFSFGYRPKEKALKYKMRQY